MKLALDTDVVVAALRSPSGASAQILRHVRHGQITMVASVSLFMEYEAVCTRPEHLAAAGLDSGQARIYLDALAALVEPVNIHYLWRPQLRDPADELVLEAAVNGHASALLSFNLRHFRQAASRFGLVLARPGDFLHTFKEGLIP